MTLDLKSGLKTYFSFQETLAGTLDDLKKGILHGSIFGASGAYLFGLPGAVAGFGSGVVFNLINSPSNTSWKKFVRSRVPHATPQERISPWSWKAIATIAGSLGIGFVLGKGKMHDFFDFSVLQDLAYAITEKKNFPANALTQQQLFSSIKETAGLAWKLSWLGYMAYQANKTLSNGFLAYVSKDVKKFANISKIPFESKESRILLYEQLAKEQNHQGLYQLQKTLLDNGKEKEGLAAILQYYFKEGLVPASPYGSHAGKKQLVFYELQKKSSLHLFTSSLLLPVDKSLVNYYGKKAVDEAKKKQDVATLSLLATYLSYTNDPNANQVWKDIVQLSTSSSLEEKVLGEGNSGGASQLFFSGTEDDPLRWSIITSTGKKEILKGKYLLGKALAKKRSADTIFSTPDMISLQDEGERYRLFRKQLWGVPLDEFSLERAKTRLDSLYKTILDGINQLQNAYDEQDDVPIFKTKWEKKYLAKKNFFYDASSIEQSLDWLLENNHVASNDAVIHYPIVDPFVRNIGVRQLPDTSLALSYWDIEPKTRAPRIYDYATLLLTLRPYASSQDFSTLRNYALKEYEQKENLLSETVNRAYAGAVVLRGLSLLKAWSNSNKQAERIAHRDGLLTAMNAELVYLSLQDDATLSSFVDKNISLLSNIKEQLPVLVTRFST